MSVAKCLGVDDFDAPNMQEVRAQRPSWANVEPALSVVDDVTDVPRWMKQAEPAGRDAVLSALRRVADHDARAFSLLAWLLVPGASPVAGKRGRLADAIDEVVAGQLWIQVCEHDPADSRYVAKKILDRVARESMAELGVGDLAKRRDPAWAATILVDRFDESIPSDAEEVEDPGEQLTAILRRALDDGDLTVASRDLLLDLAHAAHLVDAPLRRGRAGLTAPSVAQMVCDDHALSARSARRHAADDIDVLASVARRPGLAI